MSDEEIMWGSLAVPENEGLENIKNSYGLKATHPHWISHQFTIASDGTVLALVEGDMGYESTHITIPRQHILNLVEDWPEVTILKEHS